jgi:hypothetical protein
MPAGGHSLQSRQLVAKIALTVAFPPRKVPTRRSGAGTQRSVSDRNHPMCHGQPSLDMTIDRTPGVRGSEFGLFAMAPGRPLPNAHTHQVRAAGTGGRSRSWPSATLDELKDQFRRFRT